MSKLDDLISGSRGAKGAVAVSTPKAAQTAPKAAAKPAAKPEAASGKTVHAVLENARTGHKCVLFTDHTGIAEFTWGDAKFSNSSLQKFAKHPTRENLPPTKGMASESYAAGNVYASLNVGVRGALCDAEAYENDFVTRYNEWKNGLKVSGGTDASFD